MTVSVLPVFEFRALYAVAICLKRRIRRAAAGEHVLSQVIPQDAQY